MSFTGLAKQYNKVNQYMSEKIWNVEGTKHEEEFNDNEKLTHSIAGFVHEVQGKTIEMIQPNPTLRASATVKSLTSKVQGKQTRSGKYQQTEQEFADTLEKYSKEFESHPGNLAVTLRNLSEGYGQMAEIKDNLDTGVQQTFLEPLACLENKEIKSILANLKKLESRRLDYDCKKRQKEKGKQISEAEMTISEDKFNESKQSCETAMRSLINSDVEVLATMKSLVDLQIDYFSNSLSALRKIQSSLQTSIDEAKTQSAARPKGSSSLGSTPTAAPRNKAASAASTPVGSEPASFTNGGGSGQMGGDLGSFGTNNSGFKLQPPQSLAASSSLSTSTPSDLNQFGNSSNNLSARNPDLANSSSMLNGNSRGPVPAHPTTQDPWELPSVNNSANSPPDPWSSPSMPPPSGPVPALRQNSTATPFGSSFGNTPTTPQQGGNSLYPSLNPPPVVPKPANIGPPPSLPAIPKRPHCVATFDFEAESPEELGFKEGQKIMLTAKIDDNWFEGRLDGNPKVGRFPVSFVQVVVPL